MSLKEKIIEAKELMGIKAAHIIAKDLNLDRWDSENLKGCCYWHKENTPSLIYNKKENYLKCFSCGKVYSILDHYQQHGGLSYVDAVKYLFAEVGLDTFDISFKNKDKDNDDYFKDYIYPQEEKNNSMDNVISYLAKRGLSSKTLDYADIKEDSYGNIVFEHRDTDNTLLCVKYRPARAVKKGEQKMWWQKNSSTCPILYNLNRVDVTKPLLITEGHIDTLSCIEAGYYNVVSIPHGANDLKWIEFNYSFLENFDEIILYFDNDPPGQKAVKEVSKRIGEHRCKIVKPSKEIEDQIELYYKNFNPDLFIRKTDANNVLVACGQEELFKLINGAEEIPIVDVIKLMSCDEFNINDAEIISTGNKKIDRKIYGYIGGTLNIFTGYSGEGKTTTMMQSCVLPALEQGYKVFIFSGELHKSLVKNWVMYPLASSRHIMEFDNGENRPKGYSVTHDAKKNIEKYYEDKIFFYDNYLNTKPNAIIEKMVYTYKKYGTKVFIIDNMLCLDFGNENEQYSSQKEFMMNLIAVTAKYGLFVHLAAHPRKPGLNKNPDIYSIFGTSAITNLVHRIFWVLRDFEEDSPYDGKIWLGKDRMTGISNESFSYYYDRATRRIYTDDADLNTMYKWEESIRINYPESVRSKLLINKKNDADREVFG